MENKRVTAIAALMAVAFIGLCYKGYESYSAFKDSQAQIIQTNSKIETFQSEEIPPTVKNSQIVHQAADEVKKLAGALSQDIAKYVTFCRQGDEDTKAGSRAYKPDVNPVAFQNRLKELSSAIMARANRTCQLNNGAADFGMTSLKNQAPKEVDAPYLNFLLSAVNRVEEHLISSGAPSIERVYCAPLPEESINARRKPDYFPLSFEVAFTARRSDDVNAAKPDTFSVLPQVINKLVKDENFFFIITGMAVGTQGNLPIVTGPDAAAAAAEAPSDDAPQETTKSNASLITGKIEDRVNVHLNIQVLYFTTDKL